MIFCIEMPYRGPEYYQAGEYTYKCTVAGDFCWFQGYEEIYWGEEKVYECYFHGGGNEISKTGTLAFLPGCFLQLLSEAKMIFFVRKKNLQFPTFTDIINYLLIIVQEVLQCI